MAEQVMHGCSLSKRATDQATPVRLSKDELDKVAAKAKEKGIGVVALEGGVHSVHPDLMPIVKEVIGDRPLV